MNKFIITQDDFNLISNGKYMTITTQVGTTQKQCTIEGPKLKAFYRDMQTNILNKKLAKLKDRLQTMLVNQTWSPTKEMFDVDKERCKEILNLQQLLVDIHNTLAEYAK